MYSTEYGDSPYMHLVVDVDGVLADQVPPVLKRLNKKYGLRVSKKQIRQWDQPIAQTDIKTEIENSLLDPQFVLSMRLIRGARPALIELVANHSITIATNREPQMDKFTQQWLQKKDIPYHRYVNTRKHGKGAISGDVLIDDYPQNLAAFLATGGLAILFSQPWNEDDHSLEEAHKDDQLVRAHRWKEVVAIINSIE